MGGVGRLCHQVDDHGPAHGKIPQSVIAGERKDHRSAVGARLGAREVPPEGAEHVPVGRLYGLGKSDHQPATLDDRGIGNGESPIEDDATVVLVGGRAHRHLFGRRRGHQPEERRDQARGRHESHHNSPAVGMTMISTRRPSPRRLSPGRSGNWE